MLYNILPPEIYKFFEDVFEIIEIRVKVGREKGVEFIVKTNEKNHFTIFGIVDGSCRGSQRKVTKEEQEAGSCRGSCNTACVGQ